MRVFSWESTEKGMVNTHEIPGPGSPILICYCPGTPVSENRRVQQV